MQKRIGNIHHSINTFKRLARFDSFCRLCYNSNKMSETQANLIAKLQEAQKKYGYVTTEAVDEISRLLKISQSKIYGVATFYAQFRFSPPPEHTIKVCLGTACHVRGAEGILEALEKKIGVSCPGVSCDNKFGLERVACFGCCALGPIVVIDDKVYSNMTPNKVLAILKKIK